MHGMEITAEQYERIQDCLPVQRGNVRHDNLVLLNAILYLAEHGCKWRQEGCVGSGVRKIATRADSAAQDRSLQFGLDVGKGTPRRDGGFKKNGPQAIGKSREDGTPKFIWLPQCSNGHNFLLVPGRSARCSGGPATGAGIEHDPGRTAQVKPTPTLGLRSRTLQETQ